MNIDDVFSALNHLDDAGLARLKKLAAAAAVQPAEPSEVWAIPEDHSGPMIAETDTATNVTTYRSMTTAELAQHDQDMAEAEERAKLAIEIEEKRAEDFAMIGEMAAKDSHYAAMARVLGLIPA